MRLINNFPIISFTKKTNIPTAIAKEPESEILSRDRETVCVDRKRKGLCVEIEIGSV